MKDFLGLGIAGNFANHLEQAGEAADFTHVVSDEDGAPKGIFPFYIPNDTSFLGRYCINQDMIILPSDTSLNVQAEPEIGLECEVVYENNQVARLIPKYFMAFNDASVRNDKNATKISQKKNFSVASKGYGAKIPIDKFEKGGICDNYSLTSFLISNNEIYQYGDNTQLMGYSYFYQKLIDWIAKKLNTQTEHAVLENLLQIIQKANYPKKIIIAIGATSYTKFGEERFLQEGDTICIVSYNHTKLNFEKLRELLIQNATEIRYCSIVRQKVVRG